LRGKACKQAETKVFYHERERYSRAFQRTIPLSSTSINPKGIKVNLSDGVLFVHVPKDLAKAKASQIAIE